MRSMRPGPAAAATMLFGLGAWSGTARAATTFDPQAYVGWTYTDNVNYTEAVPAEAATSIQYGLELPVVKTTPSKTFSLSYRPAYYKYEEGQEELDHGEHMAEANFATSLDRRNRYKVRADYQDTQSQNYPLAGEEGEESLLYYRTQRQVFGAFFNLDRDFGRTWVGNGAISWQVIEIDDIEGFSSGVPADELGQRESFNVSLGSTREVALGRRVGFEYGYDAYSEENRDDETVHRLRGRFSDAASRTLSYTASLGASYRVERQDYTGDGSADLVRLFERGTLTFGASYGVANAGVVPGGNTSAGARIEYSEGLNRTWSWSLSSRYMVRDSAEAGDPDVDNLRGGAALRYRGPQLGRFGALGFRVAGYAVDQTSDDDPSLEASYATVSVDLVAYLGRQGG